MADFHVVRGEKNLKVRQPLYQVTDVLDNAQMVVGLIKKGEGK